MMPRAPNPADVAHRAHVAVREIIDGAIRLGPCHPGFDMNLAEEVARSLAKRMDEVAGGVDAHDEPAEEAIVSAVVSLAVGMGGQAGVNHYFRRQGAVRDHVGRMTLSGARVVVERNRAVAMHSAKHHIVLPAPRRGEGSGMVDNGGRATVHATVPVILDPLGFEGGSVRRVAVGHRVYVCGHDVMTSIGMAMPSVGLAQLCKGLPNHARVDVVSDTANGRRRRMVYLSAPVLFGFILRSRVARRPGSAGAALGAALASNLLADEARAGLMEKAASKARADVAVVSRALASSNARCHRLEGRLNAMARQAARDATKLISADEEALMSRTTADESLWEERRRLAACQGEIRALRIEVDAKAREIEVLRTALKEGGPPDKTDIIKH